jgi:hypothetical protein
MKAQEYNNIKVDLTLLENELREFFSRESFGENFLMETINERGKARERSGFVLKARWTWMKLSYVFKVRVAFDGRRTIVQAGEEKQTTKLGMVGLGGAALAAGALALLTAPVAIAGGVAAYRSYKIVDGIWEVIEKHMSDITRELADSDVETEHS